MVYKQAVSTEDVFLGLGLKTPTTASCEDLLVRGWQLCERNHSLEVRVAGIVHNVSHDICARISFTIMSPGENQITKYQLH